MAIQSAAQSLADMRGVDLALLALLIFGFLLGGIVNLWCLNLLLAISSDVKEIAKRMYP